MPRFQKNAAGEDVDVSGPEFGCHTVTAEPAQNPKAKPAKSAPEAAEEGTD